MKDFYKNKNILVTGHTGFKGTWLCLILSNFGANVTGYSLDPQSNPNLYSLSKLDYKINSVIGDIRDFERLQCVFKETQPEIVFHLAAQPLVIESYTNPRYTYETNVMGTVNLLECIRNTPSVKSVVNVTTDKVYKNNEWTWSYREIDSLDGHDPYSNSKSCSELVTNSYINSFFIKKNVFISTARAGNVIGGGDFSKDRIIPDSVKSASNNENIVIRNPNSVRPYQHVLEPLFAYLLIAKKQYENGDYSGSYNVGPNEEDCISTRTLVSIFTKQWEIINLKKVEWTHKETSGPHEANYLKLDCSKVKNKLGWFPTWNIEKAIIKTVEWTKVFMDNGNISDCMNKQILEFISECVFIES